MRSAPPIIRKIHKRGVEPDPLRGLFATTIDGRPVVVEYEPDSDLRDSEQIPLTELGGIDAFLEREVLPYAADAWYRPDKVKIGYEISFTRYFYKRSRLGASRRSGRTFWRWSGRRRGCSGDSQPLGR